MEVQELTPIQKFYESSSIFLTGGTGFMGKILLEKLLRSCTGIKSVYLLIRAKKNKDVQQRLDELWEDPVFTILRKGQPNFHEKIIPIIGDCSVPFLGISEQDKLSLIDNVNVVFHAAATVRFDEKIRLAMRTNVYATKDIADICQKMTNLKAFVYISTAYSHTTRRKVEEVYYSGRDGDEIREIVDKYSDEQLDQMMPSILGKWKNTYTLTKAMAEDVVRDAGRTIPIVIFRPGIVIGTAEEPIKGWIDNLYGPTGVVVGCGAGLLRAMLLDKNTLSNIVPADYTINCLIASPWDMENSKNAYKPIYNYVSNGRKPLTWGKYLDMCFEVGKFSPSLQAIWYSCLVCTTSRSLFYVYCFLLHLLPAFIMDMGLKIQGKKEKMLTVYKKIHKYLEVIAYFSTHSWIFSDSNVVSLLDRMAEEDKKIFYCDLVALQWMPYMDESIRGIRKYLFKEDPATIPEAIVRMKKLWLAHRTLQFVLLSFSTYCFYSIYSFAV